MKNEAFRVDKNVKCSFTNQKVTLTLISLFEDDGAKMNKQRSDPSVGTFDDFDNNLVLWSLLWLLSEAPRMLREQLWCLRRN